MKRHAITMLLLLAATAALGQIHGVPASVTSIGFSQQRVPASVTSLGPNGFGRCCARVGAGFGFGNHPRFFVGVNTFPPRHRFFPRVFPVLVPVYSYPVAYPAYPVGYEANAIDDSIVQPYAADDHRGATIYERNYEPARSLADDAARYGEHYLDSREERRAEPENRREPDVRVIPGPKAPASQAAAAQQEPATVLIFKNGDRMEVHNYAIVGEMVWVLSGTTSHKFALTELDVPKTVKENDERGLEFKLPRHG